MTTERPTTLLAELTHRCPLHCPYCSNPLEMIRAEGEIATEDWKRVFTQARELGVLQLGLSGGEPLIRKDLEELAAHARGLGLYTTLVTSGLGLTRPRAERLREAGLEHIQISIQDADSETAERIAGVSSVKQKRAAAAIVKELGFAFSINVVLHRANLDRIGRDHRSRRRRSAPTASSWPTPSTTGGRWRTGPCSMPTREQVARAQVTAEEAMRRYRGRMQILFVLPDYFEQYPKPCYGGLGQAVPGGRAGRPGAALPRRDPDHHPVLRQRPRPLPRVDLEQVARVPGVPRRRMDAGALPQLPAQDDRFRRLPLPGVRAHRGGGEHRSGLHALARARADRRRRRPRRPTPWSTATA